MARTAKERSRARQMLKIQQGGARAEGKVHAAALKKVSRQKTAATAISIAGAIPPVGRALKGAVAGAKGAYAAGKAILTRAARGHAKNQAKLAQKAATKTAVKKAFKPRSLADKAKDEAAAVRKQFKKLDESTAKLHKKIGEKGKQIAKNNKELGKPTRPSDLTIPKTRAAQRDAVRDAFKNRSKPSSKGGMKKTASDANTKADHKKLGIKPGNKNRKKPGGSSTNPPQKGKFGNKPTPDKTNRKPTKGESYDEQGNKWPPKKPWE
jgi:hypothetical protein